MICASSFQRAVRRPRVPCSSRLKRFPTFLLPKAALALVFEFVDLWVLCFRHFGGVGLFGLLLRFSFFLNSSILQRCNSLILSSLIFDKSKVHKLLFPTNPQPKDSCIPQILSLKPRKSPTPVFVKTAAEVLHEARPPRCRPCHGPRTTAFGVRCPGEGFGFKGVLARFRV